MCAVSVICTYGVPGCGKSWWSIEYVKSTKKKTVIVNLDDLRSTMFGNIHNYKFNDINEKYIQETQR